MDYIGDTGKWAENDYEIGADVLLNFRDGSEPLRLKVYRCDGEGHWFGREPGGGGREYDLTWLEKSKEPGTPMVYRLHDSYSKEPAKRGAIENFFETGMRYGITQREVQMLAELGGFWKLEMDPKSGKRIRVQTIPENFRELYLGEKKEMDSRFCGAHETVGEAARRLGMSEEEVRREMRNGGLAYEYNEYYGKHMLRGSATKAMEEKATREANVWTSPTGSKIGQVFVWEDENGNVPKRGGAGDAWRDFWKWVYCGPENMVDALLWGIGWPILIPLWILSIIGYSIADVIYAANNNTKPEFIGDYHPEMRSEGLFDEVSTRKREEIQFLFGIGPYAKK